MLQGAGTGKYVMLVPERFNHLYRALMQGRTMKNVEIRRKKQQKLKLIQGPTPGVLSKRPKNPGISYGIFGPALMQKS